MKTAVQTISKESSRPDPGLACDPRGNCKITLPQPSQPPIDVHNGQTIQWQYDRDFSVVFDRGGVFQPSSIRAEKKSETVYLTSPLRVIGPPKSSTTCKYNLFDANSPDVDPPPPNVIIVDNSSPWPGEK
jgi:hypothetical protein